MLSKNAPFYLLVIIALVIILIAFSAKAAPLDARDSVNYSKQDTYNSGWVNLTHPTGGQYIYDADANKTIKTDKAFMVGKPLRQDFEFLTAQEQEGIWLYRNNAQQAAINSQPQKLETRKNIARTYKSKHPHNSCNNTNIQNINWPKIVVNGTKTCVPLANYSDASDWKDHLICTETVGSNGK